VTLTSMRGPDKSKAAVSARTEFTEVKTTRSKGRVPNRHIIRIMRYWKIFEAA
jgi:hypothetical protein